MARTKMAVLLPLVIALNPISRPFAAWLPFFGVLTYKGWRTGRTYRTPINVFRRGDRYVFFLTYGSDVQWVKNVQAAGECSIRTLGREVRLVDPELIVDPDRRLDPLPVRIAGRVWGVTVFLRLRAAPAAARLGEIV
jgi:deazaflavin-dependent oxidoreductase (nitroreductase family)